MEDSVPGKLHNENDAEGDSKNTEETESEEKETMNICGPCGEEEKVEGAQGFCVDCQDYLCENCFKCHCIPKPTKHHKVLDKNDMPKRKVERDLSDVCLKHKGEIIKHYCKDHSVIGCYSCIYPEHNSCTETCLLEDAVYGTESSPMYKDFFKRVSELKEEYDKQHKKALANDFDRCHYYSAARTSIKAIQKTVNEHFEKLTEYIVQQATEINTRENRRARHIKETSESALKELCHLKEDLQLLAETKQSKQLFMVINRAIQNQDYLEERIKSLKLDNNVRKYKFIPNSKLETLIKDIDNIGTLSIERQ